MKKREEGKFFDGFVRDVQLHSMTYFHHKHNIHIACLMLSDRLPKMKFFGLIVAAAVVVVQDDDVDSK